MLEAVVKQQLLQLQVHRHVAVEGRSQHPAQRLQAAQRVAYLRTRPAPSPAPPAGAHGAELQPGLGARVRPGASPACAGLERPVVQHQRHRQWPVRHRTGLQHRIRRGAGIAEWEHVRRRPCCTGRRHLGARAGPTPRRSVRPNAAKPRPRRSARPDRARLRPRTSQVVLQASSPL